MTNSKLEKTNRFIQKPFYSFLLIVLILFLGALIYDHLNPPVVENIDGDESEVAIDPLLNDELPELTKSVFLLSETDLLDTSLLENVQSISISDSLNVTEPSFFLADYDEVNPKFDRVYSDLLENGHAVLFIGKTIEAEHVVSYFSEFDIPVVPIEGSLPTIFQGYGAMYSSVAKDEIPIFFATNSTDEFQTSGLIRALSNLESHFKNDAK